MVGHGGRRRQHFANKPGRNMKLLANLRLWWKAIVNRSRIGREVEEEFKPDPARHSARRRATQGTHRPWPRRHTE